MDGVFSTVIHFGLRCQRTILNHYMSIGITIIPESENSLTKWIRYQRLTA
jgi:hypothetical protein